MVLPGLRSLDLLHTTTLIVRGSGFTYNESDGFSARLA